MSPLSSLLVIAFAAFACPALGRGFSDEASLLQAELEKAKAPKAPVVEIEDGEPPEPICEQLAGKGGSCERLVSEPLDLFGAAAPQEKKKKAQAPPAEQPQPEQAANKPAKSAGSCVLGYVLDALVVVLVIDGLRRWHQGKAERAAEAEPEAEHWDSLMQAALAGDEARCEALMSKEASISGADLWGCTVLHAASKGGAAPVVRKLLERGATVDEPDSWDETPLHLAARAGHVSVCELLLAYGAPIDAANAQDWTPLVVGAEAGHEAVCRYLLGQGAGVGDLDESMQPALLVSLIAESGQKAEENDEEEEEEAEFARRVEEEYWLREQALEGTEI